MDRLFELEMWRAALAESLKSFVDNAMAFAPRLLGAIIIIGIGWGLSRLCQALSSRVLRSMGLNQLVARLELTATMRSLLRERTLSDFLARFIFWFAFIAFVVLAADTLGVRAITNATNIVVGYLPRVLGAVVIIVASILLGRFARRLVESGAALGRLEQAPRIGALANAVVVVTGSILAMEQLGVSTEILIAVTTTLVAALALAMSIAFALGAKHVVAHVLAGHFLRQRLAQGQDIEVDGIRGIVQQVGAVDTALQVGDDLITFPNARLLDETIKRSG